ncbi:MAG: hypothetical protein CMJ31_02490 [Phycisphaerae bacterium]|nr:hypothetical protein [Phycisphaerae bacterium]
MFGACIGSLINVLVYRMPLGIGVVTPPSRCPACETRLTWRENIPVLGWILLGGRCRFCRSKISPEYPLVEALAALLFAGLFALWFAIPSETVWLGVDWGGLAPDWTRNGFADTWPTFAVTLVAVACLLAMTLVDAKTFTIPLVLAWIPAIVAVVALPAHAAWVEFDRGPVSSWIQGDGYWLTPSRERWYAARGWLWSLATPGAGNWRLIGSSIGAVIGLGMSVLLVRLKLIGQSFADYAAWEEKAIAAEEAAGRDTPELWIQYPHARREMIKELAFVAPPVLLFIAGGWAAYWLVGAMAGPWTAPAHAYGDPIPPVLAPLWLVVLSGSLLGYLIGGAVVWGVRIFGSLAFGKEAMGIGDVHLLAGAGACFGWIDVSLGFFAAAFVALFWTILGFAVGGKLKRAMPFGPFLAVGTFLVVVCKPAVELFLTLLLSAQSGIDLP